MKRLLLIVAVTASATGLFGTGWVAAENMGGTSSGSSSGGGTAVSGVGWTAEPAKAKAKVSGAGMGAGAPAIAGKGATMTVASKGAGTTVASKGSETTVPNKGATTTVASKGAGTADVRGPTSMGGMLPMVTNGADSKIDVKNHANGVTITISSSDPATAARLQKMAEAMRLMHEATHP